MTRTVTRSHRFNKRIPLTFCLLFTAHVAQAQHSLFNSRVPKEAVFGNNGDIVSGRCLPTPEGWLEIIGYVWPGDGFRHTVVGRCMEDGSVLILQDDPHPWPP